MHASESPPIVVGLGEVLWDCFADSRRPGGAPANVAYQANQLGCRGIVCSRVGKDELGDELVGFLQQQGLSVDYVQRDAEHPTGTVTVDTSQADHPVFTIHENVAWDFIELNDSVKALVQSAAAVCFGTLAQRGDVSRRTIQHLLAAVPQQSLVVYDVNLRQRWYARPWIEQSLEAAGVAKLNSDEVVELARLLETSSADEEPFARELIERFGLDTVCVTRGADGCLLVDAQGAFEVPGLRVDVADAVGAGDAFTAALIYSRLSGWSIEKQGRFANRVGALVASKAGAMPPMRDDLAALLAEFR
jgi:fructokinase